MPDPIFLDRECAKAFRPEANRAVAALTKLRARAYARRPESLDSVCMDLSRASPDDMIAVATRLLARERDGSRRWFGFGGEIQALNARAIILLGRVRRKSTFTATAAAGMNQD
ncbi:hypothetical protein [Methylocapsa palsarum]|uniref:Uncharacterized protein n=1 Tax=Methylocapsa palsarum TaxID=1612308 RepID=A0A1I4BGN7_9HYPH|nr:hypothetical protein [Methylocapsa palsarum]SFK67141.1 hypothetical protein SAMN05444581_11491 [Methylocapsa palsarum]